MGVVKGEVSSERFGTEAMRKVWIWAWRIGIVSFILCMAAIFTLIALSASASKETAPPWGQEINTTAPATYSPGVDRGDNITVNLSCPSGLVWFKTNLLYIDSSNDTLANSGAYVQKLNFWMVAANSDQFYISFTPDQAPYYCYTFNIERAVDAKDRQIQELQERVQDLTAQLGNITVLNITNVTQVLHNETFQNITVVNGTDFNSTYLEVNISLLEDQLQDLQLLLYNLMVENRTVYVYNNTTVQETWEGVNDTLANISELQQGLAQLRASTPPVTSPYNDSELRARVQDLSKVTNTTQFNNETVTVDRVDLGASATAGVLFGTISGIAVVLLVSRRKGLQSHPSEGVPDEEVRLGEN